MRLTPIERAEKNGRRAAGARPIGQRMGDGGYIYNEYAPGLTKREHIAAMALQGFIGGDLGSGTELVHPSDAEQLARNAVRCADALLVALEAEPS